MNLKKTFLSFECLILFGVVPGLLVYFQRRGGLPFLPVLFGFLILTLLVTWRDQTMRFNPPKIHKPLPEILIRLLASAIVLPLGTAVFAPQLFFFLPRENPALWLLIMILYPIISVAPQEFIFRSYFMQRYRPLFGEGPMICMVNALAFGWAHVFFLNAVAPLLSVPAGWFLARTWQQSQSFKRICVEHAIYGQIVFTCGLGWYFFQGSAQALQNFTP
ncbi:CPBP family glutamic-type intramembrane protease [Kiritimatiellaeota bacterium B1221]|nr:CPBP family glutamic-type intramembrane protease [Kiritimatiellaeota bacterium B1221]